MSWKVEWRKGVEEQGGVRCRCRVKPNYLPRGRIVLEFQSEVFFFWMNIQQLELVERRRYSKLSGTRKYPKLNNLLTLYSHITTQLVKLCPPFRLFWFWIIILSLLVANFHNTHLKICQSFASQTSETLRGEPNLINLAILYKLLSFRLSSFIPWLWSGGRTFDSVCRVQ